MTIQAIETRYAGCRFRSRLEARWAVFFDTLGIKWEYEPQGFDISGTPYLPDFHLPGLQDDKVPGLDTWAEVKGDMNKLDYKLSANAAGELGAMLILGEIPRGWNGWLGLPLHPMFSTVSDRRGKQGDSVVTLDSTVFVIADGKPNVMRTSIGRGSDRSIFCADKLPMVAHKRVKTAYDAARSARFEHGESG